MKFTRLFLVAGLTMLFSSCASVSSTAIFYQPTTSICYPPKDKNTIIPILNAPPTRPFTEIGRFAFQSTLGYPFVQKSLIYNAQRAGADAVIIKNYQTWSMPYLYSVPPFYGCMPFGGWYGGVCGPWYGWGAVPVVYPGYTGVSYQNFTGIDARMIIFK
jgi:hypothetical protein